jgi:hypothetical protein
MGDATLNTLAAVVLLPCLAGFLVCWFAAKCEVSEPLSFRMAAVGAVLCLSPLAITMLIFLGVFFLCPIVALFWGIWVPFVLTYGIIAVFASTLTYCVWKEIAKDARAKEQTVIVYRKGILLTLQDLEFVSRNFTVV